MSRFILDYENHYGDDLKRANQIERRVMNWNEFLLSLSNREK